MLVPDRTAWRWLALALVLRLIMAWSNYGFVAMDDYMEMLSLAIPAQHVEGPAHIVATANIRSPAPKLTVYALGQTALAVGLDDPVNQVRFIYTMVGLLSMVAVWGVWWMFRRLDRSDWALHGLLWCGLHVLAVYASTRALIESLSLPFFTLAAVFLVVYAREGRLRWLLWSLVALTVASVFRFQAGVGIVALLAVPVVQRKWRDLAVMLGLGVALFLFTGWLDFLARGSFHHSLQAYFLYNLRESSTYGRTPWWAYLAMLAAATMPPLLLSRYRAFPWRDYWRELWPLLVMVAAFVAFHSVVPHKEDRFMIPVMAAYFAMLAPLSAFLWQPGVGSWRRTLFFAVNLVLFVAIAAVPSQNNVIGVARYVGEQDGLERLWSVEESAWPYVTGYTAHETPELHQVETVPPMDSLPPGCQDIVAVRSDRVPPHATELEGWTEVAAFGPGIPERLVIMINPEHNTRRNPIVLFVPDRCRAEMRGEG